MMTKGSKGFERTRYWPTEGSTPQFAWRDKECEGITCSNAAPPCHKGTDSSASRLTRLLFNLGCLHPVARVISYDMGFNPSTQR
jgi:hypothetical protein